jgi:hypothetical protein
VRNVLISGFRSRSSSARGRLTMSESACERRAFRIRVRLGRSHVYAKWDGKPDAHPDQFAWR